MKIYKYILICLIGIILFPTSCIIPFEPKGIRDTRGILVVEGIIMESGTTIKISRTVSMYDNSSENSFPEESGVFDAHVNVIDDENNLIAIAELQIDDGKTSYIVSDSILFTPQRKYAIDIQIGDKRYQSAFVSPVRTPEIDEISWQKKIDGSMDIMVSTHDPENQNKYYCWSFEEEWEIRSLQFGAYRYEISSGELIEQSLFTPNNRYYCWASDKSKSFILGSSDKLTEATIKDKTIQNFPTNNTRFSYLYSILVKQYALDKDAYMYFDNIKKNIEQSGSLFAPLLAETKGNITCITNPEEPVIGYIASANEVSARVFIDMQMIGGEDIYNCNYNASAAGQSEKTAYRIYELEFAYAAGLGIVYVEQGIFHCSPIRCVDCTKRGGTKNKPDFWPNDHQ